MDTSPIVHWLASAQDFAQGVALYEQLGSSRVYKRLFAQPATSYSREVLVQQLQALALPAPAPTAPPEPPPVAVSVPAPNPTALNQVRDQLRQVRDERSQLHAQLTAPGLAKKNRFLLADRIWVLTDQEAELKLAEAHVLAHGRLPGPVPTTDLDDVAELQQRLARRLSVRSKVRANPARHGELPALEEEIQLIRTKLTPA